MSVLQKIKDIEDEVRAKQEEEGEAKSRKAADRWQLATIRVCCALTAFNVCTRDESSRSRDGFHHAGTLGAHETCCSARRRSPARWRRAAPLCALLLLLRCRRCPCQAPATARSLAPVTVGSSIAHPPNNHDTKRQMKRTQVNKATMGHLGMLKAKLAKLRRELLEPSKGGGGGGGDGFDVNKVGDARVGFVGELALCLPVWLTGWLAGWLAGRLAGWLTCR